MLYCRKDDKSCEFAWARGRLFDRYIAEAYHRECLAVNVATVQDVSGQQRRKAAPVPLCTLEMQKRAGQALRMSGERIMKLAEEMYQGGYLSYPRTETTLFSQGYDLAAMVSTQAESGQPWSGYAQRLLGPNGQFRWPRSGGKDDGAHPPIHPTKAFDSDVARQRNPSADPDFQDKKRLYEFIARYFLACCSPDAEGMETKVVVNVSSESFAATGLMVTARNWLDVYPYTSWGGTGALPLFQAGQTFVPSEIRLHEGRTQPPPRMHEADLLAKMDEFGIGTDATVADHIAKQLERGYATKDEATQTFAPTPLGESLISAYKKMGLENLWLPSLRGVIERNITAIARGERRKEQVLREAIDAFRSDFESALAKSSMLEQEVREIVFGLAQEGRQVLGPSSVNVMAHPDRRLGFENESNNTSAAHNTSSMRFTAIIPGAVEFGTCSCGTNSLLLLVPAGDGAGPTVMCTAPVALHGWRKDFPPRITKSISVSEEACHVCSGNVNNHGPSADAPGRESRQVYKLCFTFARALLPPMYGHLFQCTRCICCDQEMHALLDTIGSGPRRQFHLHASTQCAHPLTTNNGSTQAVDNRGNHSSRRITNQISRRSAPSDQNRNRARRIDRTGSSSAGSGPRRTKKRNGTT